MSRRVLSLALVLVVAGGGTAAARARQPGSVTAPAASALALTGSAAVPVCPGPQTLLAPDGGAAVPEPGPVVLGALAASASALAGPGATSSAPVAPTASIGLMKVGQDGPPAGGSALTASTSGVSVGSLTLRKPGALRLDARRTGAVPSMAATQLSLARTGDLRGLAAVACAAAGTDAWLVGGGTQTGRRGRLLLANPTPAPAVVDVTVHGPDGPVTSTSGSGVVVPAGGEKALYVDALAPGLAAVAVHVHARVGRVAASLLDSLVRGLTPGGADAVVPGAPASQHQVVVGLSLLSPASSASGSGSTSAGTTTGTSTGASAGTGTGTGTGTSAAAGTGAGSGGAADPTAAGAGAVRVAVPGTQDAVVRIHLIGPSGEVDLPGGVVTVAAGAVRDVALAGVPDGEYAAVVDADVPVVAGGLVGRSVVGSAAAGTKAALGTTVPPAELAWAPGSVALRGTTALALPRLPSAATSVDGAGVPARRLVLAAPAAAGEVWVAEVAPDGSVTTPRAVTVQAQAVQVLDLDPASVGVLLRPDAGAGAPVLAAVLIEAADAAGPMVSVLPVTPAALEAATVRSAVADPEVGLG